MVSSWTVALLYQQLDRYAEVLHARRPRNDAATSCARSRRRCAPTSTATSIRDGTVAGYALFDPAGGEPELLLHPSDTRTGLRYSLLPMTRSIIAGLFTPEQAQHHLRPDPRAPALPRRRAADGPAGRPTAAGPRRIFRRAESAAFFGREIGLMYVHAHLRYGEALAVLGEADALWEALQVANPIAVTETRRQRLAAPAQRLLQQQRRRLPRPLRGERRVGRASRPARSPSTAAGASIRAARGSTPTCCSATPSASGGTSASGSRRRCCRAPSARSASKWTRTASAAAGTCSAALPPRGPAR